MTWRSVPNILVQLRTMLGSVTAWTTAGGASGQIHYPSRLASDTTRPSLVLFHDTTRESIGTATTLERGTLVMLLEAYGRYKDAVTAVDSGAGTVTVAADVTSQLAAGDDFYIDGSTANDGWYKASSVVYTTSTVVTIDASGGAALQDDTVDGVLFTGSVEDLADQIAKGLLDLETGLPLRSCGRVGPADFPDGGEDSEIHIIARIEAETGLDTGG